MTVYIKHRYSIILIFSLLGGLHNLSGAITETVWPVIGITAGATGGLEDWWWWPISFATLTLISIFFVNKKPEIAGWMLIFSAVGGLISVSPYYILAFLLVFIAGIMCLSTKKPSK